MYKNALIVKNTVSIKCLATLLKPGLQAQQQCFQRCHSNDTDIALQTRLKRPHKPSSRPMSLMGDWITYLTIFAAINPVSASGAEQVTSAFPVRALGKLN